MLDGMKRSFEGGRNLLRELKNKENRSKVILTAVPIVAPIVVFTLGMYVLNPAVDVAGREIDKLIPDQPTPTPTLSPEELRSQRLEIIIPRDVPGLGRYEIRPLGENWLELQQIADAPWKEGDLRREVFSKIILECNGMYAVAYVPKSPIPSPVNSVTALIQVDMNNANCFPEIPR